MVEITASTLGNLMRFKGKSIRRCAKHHSKGIMVELKSPLDLKELLEVIGNKFTVYRSGVCTIMMYPKEV